MIRVTHQEGFYWAKLTNPSEPNSEKAEDLIFPGWEPVDVFLDGQHPDGSPRWRVFILGRSGSFPYEDFVWGHYIGDKADKK